MDQINERERVLLLRALLCLGHELKDLPHYLRFADPEEVKALLRKVGQDAGPH